MIIPTNTPCQCNGECRAHKGPCERRHGGLHDPNGHYLTRLSRHGGLLLCQRCQRGRPKAMGLPVASEQTDLFGGANFNKEKTK